MNTDNQSPQSCARRDDLLDYLYDELDAGRRRDFDRHLSACGVCRDELHGCERVRRELSAWELGMTPRVEVVVPRRPLDVLRELVGLFPVWTRALTATAAAAALLLVAFALTTARIERGADGLAVMFGWLGEKNAPPSLAPDVQPASVALTQAQVQTLIEDAVAKERTQMQSEFRAQFTALETQLHQTQQTRIEAVTKRLRGLETRQAELMAREDASIRQWINDYRDTSGTER